jgi:carboxymethylenebutenolidase
MTDDTHNNVLASDAERVRAASDAAISGGASPEARPVIASEVAIPMPAGTCDAVFLHPETGTYPGVLLWPDGLGLRASLREMGRRLVAAGYAVLVPNPFYRAARAPVFQGPFSFQNPTDRERLRALVAPLHEAGAVDQDARAYLAFLDAQPQVDRSRPVGTQGYCMGGALALRTAAAQPQRVGAAASFHGGGLVTDQPDSPHLLAPSITARAYVAIAANDDARQPEAKDALHAAFASAQVPAEIEVYPGTLHGWCIPDMPVEGGVPIYNEAAAERAWRKLLALYQVALA